MKLDHLITKLLTSKLKRFSNIHEGEACYIFGDGPSIKWFDLKQFADLPAICCGMIPFHKDFSKLDVRYVTLVAPWTFTPRFFHPNLVYLEHLKYIIDEYKRYIRLTPDKEFFINLSNLLSLSGKNINYVYRGLPEIRNETDERLNNFDLFQGSFHSTLAIAYYLGFKEIYLVGFDAWTIQPARTRRWYEIGEGELFEATNFATDFLDILRTKMNIFTVAHDGASSNVSHINYETFTGKIPLFQENHELMSDRHLKIMASCPLYRVYPEQLAVTTG